MTRHISQDALIARSEIVSAPAERACDDHNFGLSPAIHLLMGALFLGFVSVLCLALANPGLAVPFGIIAVFIIAFFAVPTIFVRASPDKGSKGAGYRAWALPGSRGDSPCPRAPGVHLRLGGRHRDYRRGDLIGALA